MTLPASPSAGSLTRPIAGDFLLRPEPMLAAALIAFNDFWLKPRHPGVLSGKLSDVGICFLFPVLVAAALEWGMWLVPTWRTSSNEAARRRLYLGSSAFAAAYFVLIKAFDAGARLHVELLSALFPTHRFRGLADPTDLLCLPVVLVATRFLLRSRGSRLRTAAAPTNT